MDISDLLSYKPEALKRKNEDDDDDDEKFTKRKREDPSRPKIDEKILEIIEKVGQERMRTMFWTKMD